MVWLQGEAEAAGEHPHVGRPPRTCVGPDRRIFLAGTYPQKNLSCTHDVEAVRVDPPPTVSPVSQTPIYDQVRDQQITGNAQAAGADPQRISRSGRHRLPDSAAGGVATTSGDTQPIVDTRLPVWAAPPGPPPDSEQGVAAAQGLPAAVAPPAHAQQAQAQRGSDPAEPSTGHSQAAVDTAQQVTVVPTWDRDVDRGQGKHRSSGRTAPVGFQ